MATVDDKKVHPDDLHIAAAIEYDAEKRELDSEADSQVNVKVITVAEDVAVEVLGTDDDPSLPVFTFRTLFLGVGLSAFSSVSCFLRNWRQSLLKFVHDRFSEQFIPSNHKWVYFYF